MQYKLMRKSDSSFKLKQNLLATVVLSALIALYLLWKWFLLYQNE